MTSTADPSDAHGATRSAETRDALRNAALEVFADEGFHASVRQIAQRAGMSHGLIRHHFGSREGLRQAVDDWVIAKLTEAFQIDTGQIDTGQIDTGQIDTGQDGAGRDTARGRRSSGASGGSLHGALHADRRDRVIAFASDEPMIAAYLGRLVVDDPVAAQPLFDTMAARLREELEQLAKVGAARLPDDIAVVVAQVILLELGAVALQPIIERNLGMSLTSRDGAARWTDSAFDLLTHGVYRTFE